MTSPTPWSVKGIDPKAREVAKDLARRAGMTLGEWLNRMILEDDVPEEVTSESHFNERPVRSYYEPPRSVDPGPPRYEIRDHPSDEAHRMALLMDRLASRLENSEHRTGQAIGGVEQSVRDAMARIEAAERDQKAVSARVESAVAEVVEGQARLTESAAQLSEGFRRLQAEAVEPRSTQAVRTLEQALGKVAHQVYDGEDRTRAMLGTLEARLDKVESAPGGGGGAAEVADEVVGRLASRLAEAEAKTGEALESLRASFAALDGRLHSVESGGSGGDLRLEQLAADLTDRVEASRSEIAEKLRLATEARFDRMEFRLGEMADHVRAAEQRSAQAIERMGKEVLSVADTLNRRVQASEQNSAAAIEQISGEVARVAGAVEARLSGADQVHAEALERLGGEIARITERLGERIGAAERRSAQAIDEVGEQVAKVTDKFNQRHERSSEDLLERIRQSEERTARLLNEARERIDQRLAETQRQSAGAALAAPAAAAFAPEPFAGFRPAEPEAIEVEEFPSPLAAAFPSGPSLTAAERPELTAEDFDAADGFEPAAEQEAPFAAAPEAPFEAAAEIEAEAEADVPEKVPEPAVDLMSAYDFPADREPEKAADAEPPYRYEPFASESRSYALGASEEAAAETDPEFDADAALAAEGRFGEEPGPERTLTTREVIEQARAAARAAAQNGDKKSRLKGEGAPAGGGSMFSAFSRLRPKRRAGGTLQTALLIAGGAAFLSMGAAGLVVMDGQPGGEQPKRVADSLADAQSGGAAADADAPPFSATPRAAVALSPQAIGVMATSPSPGAGEDLAAIYGDGVRALEAQEPGGLDNLRRAANLGYAPAQLYIAKLYENGDGGVKKDMAEARRWTERAAEGGDRKAMHNLALYYFEGGGGGPKNTTSAAQWFRKAADLGLVDSQYNLGRLYEEGIGVSQNAAEAYKWYLIAARSGDMESRSSAQRVRTRLSAATQSVVERTAAGFRPADAAEPSLATGAGAPVDSVAVVTAQRALSRLGYYQGPTDGSVSPALRMAAAAYQRDQNMPPTGALDDTTVSRLTVFTR